MFVFLVVHADLSRIISDSLLHVANHLKKICLIEIHSQLGIRVTIKIINKKGFSNFFHFQPLMIRDPGLLHVERQYSVASIIHQQSDSLKGESSKSDNTSSSGEAGLVGSTGESDGGESGGTGVAGLSSGHRGGALGGLDGGGGALGLASGRAYCFGDGARAVSDGEGGCA